MVMEMVVVVVEVEEVEVEGGKQEAGRAELSRPCHQRVIKRTVHLGDKIMLTPQYQGTTVVAHERVWNTAVQCVIQQRVSQHAIVYRKYGIVSIIDHRTALATLNI